MRRREFITLLGSAATGWPISVLGAQGRIPRVAVLFFGYPDPSIFETGFRDGLRNLGYEEGRSIELIVRSAGGKLTTLTSLAAELIGLQVDIIVAYPTTAGIAVHQQTTEIPVVVYGGDLEATKLVASLARPGGNVTGVSGATGCFADPSGASAGTDRRSRTEPSFAGCLAYFYLLRGRRARVLLGRHQGAVRPVRDIRGQDPEGQKAS